MAVGIIGRTFTLFLAIGSEATHKKLSFGFEVENVLDLLVYFKGLEKKGSWRCEKQGQ